jgi:tRNA(Ile)-lysidine synthase
MGDLPDRALRFIRTHGLLNAGGRVVAALSGGPDSVALVLILLSLREDGRLPLHLSLAHLNHALRGAESDRDEDFCRTFAEQVALPLVVERADVRAHAAARGQSLEAAARELRYEFLGRVADSLADDVATGHHADDVAETVLLRLLRGAGLHALGAMAPSRPLAPDRPRVRLVRPLLGVPEADLRAYLAARGQAFCTDSTNRDTRFARNRVRHVLMPLLQREFPSFTPASLAGLNASALESAALVESLLDELWPRVCIRATPEATVLDSAQLSGAPPPLRKEAARRAFRALCGTAAPALRAGHLEALARLPDQPVGACVALPCGILARREHGTVRLSAESAAGWAPRPLAVPGLVELPEVELRVEACVLPPGRIGPDDAAAKATDMQVYLDLTAAGSALCVRTREPGDRFHPLGAPGEARLKEFLINQAVPRGERDRAPLVVAGDGGIAWVVGHRIGERYKVRNADGPVLQLRAVHAGEDVL